MKLSAITSTFSVAIAAFTITSTSALAHDYKVADLTINHPWTRTTIAGQTVGGGFLKIENKGKTPDALIAVEWAESKTVELHTMSMDNGVMKMRQIPKIEIPAGGTVELKPGGFHVMFMNLNNPLATGNKLPATLVFEKAGKVKVDFKVEPIDFKAGGATSHAH